ncbi:MAG: hypothetical protein M5U28_10485 [Sandaracinaceae bacterium]|nr:hypothetical protein [Sandaracinaceae bacterium]
MGSFCCMYIAMGRAAVIGAAGASSGSVTRGGPQRASVWSTGDDGRVHAYFVTIIAVSLPSEIAIIRAELADDVNAAMLPKRS